MRPLLLGLLLLATTARCAVIDATRTPTGMFTAAAQAATGATVNSVHLGRSKARTLQVTMWNTAGTATVTVEVQCLSTAPWATLANSSTALTVSAVVLPVQDPMCDYRLNVTACTTCAVNGHFSVGADLQ